MTELEVELRLLYAFGITEGQRGDTIKSTVLGHEMAYVARPEVQPT